MNQQTLCIGTMEEMVLTYSKSVRRLAWKLTNSKLYDKWLQDDFNRICRFD
jgi:hypothetical protein